jgi:hypothetical protein
VHMQRPLQFATVLLTFTFAATTLFAQRSAGGSASSNSSSSHGSHSSSTTNNSHPTSGSSTGFHRTLSTHPSPPRPDPFHQPIHLPGGGTGCFNCGYNTYGGYVYSGYGYGYYNPDYNPAGPTTTDRVLANGGTFNNINNTDDAQQYAPQQAPIYIRPEYPTQYATDNSTVNTPIQNNVVSAASDSPAILIFRDGTNLTIRNYAIYGANIVVLTPERKKFPIAALDISATEKANEAAGYELKLPAVFTTH